MSRNSTMRAAVLSLPLALLCMGQGVFADDQRGVNDSYSNTVSPEESKQADVSPEIRNALLAALRDDSSDDAVPSAAELEEVSVSAVAIDLRESQRRSLSEILGSSSDRVVTRHVVSQQGETLLYGYIDTHRVRTLSESLLIALTPDGAVRRVVVLAFAEPPEYQPRVVWYEQFRGLAASGLKYGREVDAVTGATLTGRATVDAVERIQKLHEWLLEHGTEDVE